MTLTKFQFESETERMVATTLLSPSASDAEVQSLLCGLSLRGWLTCTEKELLGRMAPENASILLICDGEYLYPDDTELFAANDLVQSTRNSSRPVKSKKLSEKSTGTNLQNIQTAVISTDSSRTLILGIASSGQIHDKETLTNFFNDSVKQFRKAYQAVNESLATIHKLMAEPSDSVIVLHRSSGCLLAASDAAASLLGEETQELLKLQFNDIKDRIGNRLHNNKFSMTNLKVADLDLTVLLISSINTNSTIDTAEQSITSQLEPSIPSHHLIHRMRNSLCALTSGITYLQSIDNNTASTTDSEVLVLMNDAISTLCYQVDTFDTLANFKNIRPVEIDIKSEVQKAVRKVFLTLAKPVIHFRSAFESEIMTFQPGVLALICECTLLSHLCNDCTDCTTIIDIVNNDNLEQAINIESDFSGCDFPAAFSHDWLEYIAYLEHLLKDKIKVEQMQTRRKLITRLNLTGTKGS